MEIPLTLADLFHLCRHKRKGTCRVRFCRKAVHGDGSTLCSKHRQEAWRRRNPTRAAFAALRDHARGRGISFTLCFGFFAELCEATGYVEGKGNRPENLSIDRIDHGRGYEPDNIRVVTVHVNSVKGNEEKKLKLRVGATVEWQRIDIAEFIRAEDERKAAHDPRKHLPADQDGGSRGGDETTEPEDDGCPF